MGVDPVDPFDLAGRLFPGCEGRRRDEPGSPPEASKHVVAEIRVIQPRTRAS